MDNPLVLTGPTGLTATLYLGDCLEVLPTLAAGIADAVVTDPPYPCIERAYGTLTEVAWWDMMMAVCMETRRILKPTGSAVFILQPNYAVVGSMRGWLWEFMAWVCREWNMVQDAWWLNTTPLPTACAIQGKLLRAALKACVWAGAPDCYRNQEAVLWSESTSQKAQRLSDRCRAGVYRTSPSGWREGTTPRRKNEWTMRTASARRGGVTPFNVLPIPNNTETQEHTATTPLPLASWWTRYICPPSGTVLDMFAGSGTMAVAALGNGCNFVGCEQNESYFAIAVKRVADALKQPRLL